MMGQNSKKNTPATLPTNKVKASKQAKKNDIINTSFFTFWQADLLRKIY